MARFQRTLLISLAVLGAACGPAAQPAESAPQPAPEAPPTAAAVSEAPPLDISDYPEITPKDLGTVAGEAAVFRHAYLMQPEADGYYQFQAFTYEDVKASEVCPYGLRFISEGTMLQIGFGEGPSTSDVDRFYVQTNSTVTVEEAKATIQGTPRKGTKVLVEVSLRGSNDTALTGQIEATVCPPPESD